MSQTTAGYTSDTTDKQWAIIQPLLPLQHVGPGRPIEIDMRSAVNAMFYLTRTGCQWENLPSEYPPSGSVYYHYRKWCLDGTWQTVNETLRQRERCRQRHKPEPTAAILDSQSVKTPKRAANAAMMPARRSADANATSWSIAKTPSSSRPGFVGQQVECAADGAGSHRHDLVRKVHGPRNPSIPPHLSFGIALAPGYPYPEIVSQAVHQSRFSTIW